MEERMNKNERKRKARKNDRSCHGEASKHVFVMREWKRRKGGGGVLKPSTIR